MSQIRFEKLLLTGAAGGLGRILRPRLKTLCDVLRVTDRDDLGAAATGEELVRADLKDADAVHAMLAGVDAVVHLGGVSVEAPFPSILDANIVGTVNLYEGCRKQGVKRVVFASSNHVVGFYRQDEVLGVDAPPRPDGFYGLSKAFGEDVARLYFDKHGIETVCVRIGSSFPEPRDRRMLATYLSYDDLERLVARCLTTPVVGYSVIYGISDNHTLFWDNTGAAHLGYRPQDSSEPHRARLEAAQPRLDPTDPATIYQGGAFVRTGPLE